MQARSMYEIDSFFPWLVKAVTSAFPPFFEGKTAEEVTVVFFSFFMERASRDPDGFISCAGRHRHPRCYEEPEEADGRDTAGGRPCTMHLN